MRVLHRVLLPICALAACHVGDPPEREPPPSWVLAGEEGPLAEPAVESCARRSPGVGPRPLASAGASSSSASSVALARAGEHLVAYVADEDERALRVVDIDERRELSQVTLEGRPSSVLIAPDGRIVVTLRDRARVEVLEPAADGAAPPALRCAIDVPSEPVGMAATPDGASLLLVSRWGHALQVFDFHSFELKRTVELPRDPQAVLSSADGKQALIAHVAGSTISVVDLGGDAALPRLISTHVTEHSARVHHVMPSGADLAASEGPTLHVHRHERFGTQGFALARLASGNLLLPQVMVETGSGTGVAGGYGDSSSFPTVVGEVSVVLPDEQRIQVTPVNRDGGSPCLLPRATAVDEVGGEVFVACMGHDTVIAYGTKASLPRRDERRRWTVGAGPTGIAVDEGSRRAVVHSAFASSLEVLALGKPRAPGEPRVDLSRPLAGTRIALARRAPLDPTLALGRSLFHGAGGRRLAADGRVCASCHPDGRDDALTWSTPDGPRQTPMLLGRLPDTGPYGWDGDRRDLPSHFSRTIARLGGAGITVAERYALFAYVQSLEPPLEAAPPPPLAARMQRGSALFHAEAVGCSGCHLGDDRTTDGDRHDVRSAAPGDATARFDTPSLRFIARSAPYFHDGRYPTLMALLEGVDGTMGHTKQLSPDDLAALGAYLESL